MLSASALGNLACAPCAALDTRRSVFISLRLDWRRGLSRALGRMGLVESSLSRLDSAPGIGWHFDGSDPLEASA
jgi:hypothetical protein